MDRTWPVIQPASEAALYRHFSSKAQMFEGLIEFIEQTVFGLVNKIQSEERDPMKQVESIIATLLGFAQKNPGMTRVLIGDALVNENERLQERMNQFLDRIETSLKQSFRMAVTHEEVPPQFDAAARSALIVAFVVGRWHRFAKTGFRKTPSDNIEAQLPALLV